MNKAAAEALVTDLVFASIDGHLFEAHAAKDGSWLVIEIDPSIEIETDPTEQNVRQIIGRRAP